MINAEHVQFTEESNALDYLASVSGVMMCSPNSLCFSNCGTVYELSPANGAYTETVLYNFSGGADGGASQSDLFLDSAGNVFGTASILGVAQAGTVFEITP